MQRFRILLGIALTATCCVYPVCAATDIQAGDAVQFVEDSTPVRVGKQAIARVPKDTQLVVEAVRGRWLLVTYKIDGKPMRGWVDRGAVRASVGEREESLQGTRRATGFKLRRDETTKHIGSEPAEVFQRVKEWMQSYAEQGQSQPGTAILEVHVSEDAIVQVDGKDFGRDRRFVFGFGEDEGVYQVHKVQAQDDSGWSIERTVLLKKGWHVRLPLTEAVGQEHFRLTPPPIFFDASAVTFSNSGDLIAVGSESGQALVFDRTTGKLVSRLVGHRSAVYDLAFVANDDKIVTASFDKTAAIWNVPSGERLGEFHGHKKGLKAAAASPDGKFLATSSWSETLVWDIATRKVIREFPAMSTSIVFSTDGTLGLACGQKAIMWNPSRDEEPREKEFGGVVSTVGFDRTGDIIATACGGRTTFWDRKTLLSIKTLGEWVKSARGAYITGGRFGPDLKSIVSFNTYGACFRDLETGAKSTIEAHVSRISQVALSPDGRCLLVGGPSAFLVDLDSGSVVQHYGSTPMSGASLRIEGHYPKDPFDWRKDDESLAGSLRSSSQWPLVPFLPFVPYELKKPKCKKIEQIHLSSDAELVMGHTYHHEQTILWHLRSAQLLHVFKGRLPYATSVSRMSVTSYNFRDPWLRIWDTATGDELVRFCAWNEAWLAVTPEGYYQGSDDCLASCRVESLMDEEAPERPDSLPLSQRQDLLQEVLAGRRPMPGVTWPDDDTKTRDVSSHVQELPPLRLSPVELQLTRGDLTKAESLTLEMLDSAEDRNQLYFQLGFIRFLKAIQEIAQFQYRHRYSYQTQFLPIDPNPAPERPSRVQSREFLEKIIDTFGAVESTLAKSKPADVKLRIPLGLVKLDLDDNGTADGDEALWRVYRKIDPVLTRKEAKGLSVAFDNADLCSLRAYCHIFMAGGKIGLACDPPPQFPLPNDKKPRLRLVDAERFRQAHRHLLETSRLLQASWKQVLAETDDDEEWIPNPRQQQVAFDIRVSLELMEAWQQSMEEMDKTLKGELLVPLPTESGNGGLNIRKLFQLTADFSIRPWLDGEENAPLVEVGELADADICMEFGSVLGTQMLRVLESFDDELFYFLVWEVSRPSPQ